MSTTGKAERQRTAMWPFVYSSSNKRLSPRNFLTTIAHICSHGSSWTRLITIKSSRADCWMNLSKISKNRQIQATSSNQSCSRMKIRRTVASLCNQTWSWLILRRNPFAGKKAMKTSLRAVTNLQWSISAIRTISIKMAPLSTIWSQSSRRRKFSRCRTTWLPNWGESTTIRTIKTLTDARTSKFSWNTC